MCLCVCVVCTRAIIEVSGVVFAIHLPCSCEQFARQHAHKFATHLYLPGRPAHRTTVAGELKGGLRNDPNSWSAVASVKEERRGGAELILHRVKSNPIRCFVGPTSYEGRL